MDDEVERPGAAEWVPRGAAAAGDRPAASATARGAGAGGVGARGAGAAGSGARGGASADGEAASGRAGGTASAPGHEGGAAARGATASAQGDESAAVPRGGTASADGGASASAAVPKGGTASADGGASESGVATRGGAATVAELRGAAPDCRGCELWRPATQVVFSAGPPSAPLMLVGEQPGDSEDRQGRPFVGPAGRLLADAVTAAGIDRGALYVTNAVKHFRFEERGPRRIHKTPAVGHIVACHPWLEAEIDAVAPQVILCLGATAGRAVLGRTVSVTRERGTVLEAPDVAARLGRKVTVLLTTHPSAVLRLRGDASFDEALDSLVADLRLAASHLG